MKIPNGEKVRLWHVLAILIMGALAAWLVTIMASDKSFPSVVTLLGMSVTAAAIVWPGFAALFTNADPEHEDSPRSLRRSTKTVSRSFAVAGPLLGAAGILLDEDLGGWGFGLSVVLGLGVIPLMLAVLVSVLPSLQDGDDRNNRSTVEPGSHH